VTSRNVLAGLGLAAMIAATVVGVLVATRSSSDSARRPVRIGTALSPRTPLFGDTVTARLEFAGDTRRVVPGSVRVDARFGSYRTVAKPLLVRKIAGDAEYVVWTASLRCLARSCLAGKAEKRLTFPPARVTYAVRGSGTAPQVARSLSVAWPALLVYSRIDPIEIKASDPRDEPPWRADLASLLNVSYRTPPSPTAAVAYGLGGMLILGAFVLAAPLRRRDEDAPVLTVELEPSPVPQTPFQRALALLERSSAGADEVGARRRALELVAVELLRRNESTLRRSAQRLAWSQQAPSEADARALARSARDATRDGSDDAAH